jgi:hypothetical protein
MINKQLTLLVAICLLFVTNAFAQRPNYSIQNSLGPFGGITQSNIKTDNFIVEEGQGWTAGLTAIVNVEHKWYDVSYGIQFTENTIAIEGRPTIAGEAEMIDFKLSGAQLSFLMHGKIIGQNLTIDFGPVIQANGFFEPTEEEKENYILTGYDTLEAKDIRDISKFNVNGAIGATAGLKNFRLRAQYQYGFTNVFGKLNKQDLSAQDATSVDKFKGNQSTLLFTALLLF